MDKSANEFVNRKAATWAARLRAPDCSDAERREFEQWLAVDAAHREAYQRAEKVSALLATVASKDERLRALADAAMAHNPLPEAQVRQQRLMRYAQLAVMVVLTVLTGWWLQQRYQINDGWAAADIKQFTNNTQRELAVVLADGSVVHLDVGARLHTRFTTRERQIVLEAGRAYFEVAHDAQRPFSVEARRTRTVALGTRFEVVMADDEVQVTLAQGSVSVATINESVHWQQRLVPGQRLAVRDGASPSVHTVNAERTLSWSIGRLVFDGEPLATVLTQFNRYTDVKVVLGDESLGSMPIGGDFAVGSSSTEFVAALTAVLPLRSERVGDHEIVLFQKHAENLP